MIALAAGLTESPMATPEIWFPLVMATTDRDRNHYLI
jgi:hypothetical protein